MANSNPGTPTTSGQRKRARTEADRNKSLKCSNAFFHLGIILTALGIIFTILAMATSSLFYVDIHSHKNKSDTHIPIGLFSLHGYNRTNGSMLAYEHPLEIEYPSLIASRILVIVGFFAAVLALIIHLLFCMKEQMRKRKIIFIEMIFLLIAMIAVLASLSFAEMQREYLHDDSSAAIAKFMVENKLAENEDMYKNNRNITGSIETKEAEFTQTTTSLMFSFYALVVATFMFLLAFLFSLVYFVRLCERINKEERELRENLTKPENMDEERAPVV